MLKNMTNVHRVGGKLDPLEGTIHHFKCNRKGKVSAEVKGWEGLEEVV